jgi:hypothetical protein
MARLYADENFPFPIVEALRAFGHDVLTIHEDGKANQRHPDEAVLADASAYSRAVLTLNRKHFKQLHYQSTNHGGMILCTYNPNFMGQAHQIDETLKAFESLEGQLIRINRPQK